jgi:hypothetical protein
MSQNINTEWQEIKKHRNTICKRGNGNEKEKIQKKKIGKVG